MVNFPENETADTSHVWRHRQARKRSHYGTTRKRRQLPEKMQRLHLEMGATANFLPRAS